MSTFTAAKNLELVARGGDVGTWDTPTNSNWSIVDASLGGYGTVALTSVAVTLSASSYQNVMLTFTGALGASVTVTLPSVGSVYTCQNLTSNTSAYIVTLTCTAAGAKSICLPPGEVTDILTDGTNVKFRNLGRVGTYFDYIGSSVPAWISGCSVPPFLYCNGGTFSSATYPILATILGSTTLPDFRGRGRFYYNDGTSRIVSTTGGVDGNTIGAAGGAQSVTLSSNNLPNTSFPVTDPTHSHTITPNAVSTNHTAGGLQSISPGAWPLFSSGGFSMGTNNTDANTTGITVNSGGSGTFFSPINPIAIGGIVLVRAA